MAEDDWIHPGPIDGSLLVLQSSHRSENIWQGQEPSPLKCRRADSGYFQLWREGQLDIRILHSIAHDEFYGVYRVGQIRFDRALITAMVERWRVETHTFHLPVGETTITLQDVEVLMGLPTLGSPVTHTNNRSATILEWCNLVEYLLISRPTPNVDIRSNSLRLGWLLDLVQTNVTNDTLSYHIRAHLLILITHTLCDCTQNHVKLKFLLLLKDLDTVHTYSWGSACLAYLYHHLCCGTNPNTSDVAGYLILLQIWTWERFKSIAPHRRPDDADMVTDILSESSLSTPFSLSRRPWGARWNVHCVLDRVAQHTMPIHRYSLDTLRDDQFVWQPYTEDVMIFLPAYCSTGQGLWRVRCPLICFEVVEWHYADRVHRQFGIQQFILRAPENSTYLNSITGRSHTNWEAQHHYHIALWGTRGTLVVAREDTHERPECDPDYMPWYRSIT